MLGYVIGFAAGVVAYLIAMRFLPDGDDSSSKEEEPSFPNAEEIVEAINPLIEMMEDMGGERSMLEFDGYLVLIAKGESVHDIREFLEDMNCDQQQT